MHTIFDCPLSDDSCTDLLLGECNISTEEPPGPSDADNFPHCVIEYKILDSSQHEEDTDPQLGKPVPFPAEDIPTLSETLIPPQSGYHSLMDASTVAAPAMPLWSHESYIPPTKCTLWFILKAICCEYHKLWGCRFIHNMALYPYPFRLWSNWTNGL